MNTQLEFDGAKPSTMQNKKLIRFVESFILLPTLTMTTIGVPLGGLTQAGYQIVSNSQIVLSQKQNMEAYGLLAVNDGLAQKLEAQIVKAKAINTYFEFRGMPLAGTGMKMVEEAENNDLDWRLIPAIAIRESTGGKHECKKVENNPFGWGSCKIGFDSYEHAIEVIAKNLGGNNHKTARHYDNKTTMQILRAYNPPSIVPRYAEQVLSIMDAIGEPEVITEIATG